MKIEATAAFEKQAPKSRAFGVRTEDGVLIKVWVPNDMISKSVDELDVALSFASKGKEKAKAKGKASKKRRIEEEDDDEDDEEDEDEDEDEEE